jgi:hypothetical protein
VGDELVKLLDTGGELFDQLCVLHCGILHELFENFCSSSLSEKLTLDIFID